MQFLAVHLLTRGGFDPLTVPAAARGADPRILRVVAHMHDNLAQPLSLADLAEVAQLSPYHFLRLFNTTVGEAPHRHLIRLRIAAARRQLERSNAPVSDIAYLCGFSSPAQLECMAGPKGNAVGQNQQVASDITVVTRNAG